MPALRGLSRKATDRPSARRNSAFAHRPTHNISTMRVVHAVACDARLKRPFVKSSDRSKVLCFLSYTTSVAQASGAANAEHTIHSSCSLSRALPQTHTCPAVVDHSSVAARAAAINVTMLCVMSVRHMWVGMDDDSVHAYP